MKINLKGLFLCLAIPFTGYCFAGKIGAGVGTLFIILVNLL